MRSPILFDLIVAAVLLAVLTLVVHATCGPDEPQVQVTTPPHTVREVR